MYRHKLEPIPAEKFRKFVEAALCEARGSFDGRVCYWRFDLKKPVQFREDGLVPVIEIQITLRTLSMTVDKYLSMLDSLFPSYPEN